MGQEWPAHSETSMRTCIEIGAQVDQTDLVKARKLAATHDGRVSLLAAALKATPPRRPRAQVGDTSMAECRIEGCDDPATGGRGLCVAHRQRFDYHRSKYA